MLTMSLMVPLLPDGKPDKAAIMKELDGRLEALTYALNGGTPRKAVQAEFTALTQEEGLGQALYEAGQANRKRGGRKVDPNSMYQRVMAAIKSLLATGKKHKDWIVGNVVNMTGIAEDRVIGYAMKVPGITREYGVWSLKAA